MIIIKKYNIEQLKKFIASAEFEQLDILPISRPRAESYINNPRADKDDVVMYLAYEGEKLIAYRLILPDKIFMDGNPVKMGWFSCIYVHPGKRGSGIAKQLTAAAMKDWKGMICLDDPVVASGKLYKDTGKFRRFPGKEGVKAYLRFNFKKLWLARGNRNRLIKSTLGLFDTLLNTLKEPTLKNQLKKLDSATRGNYKYLESIDEEAAAYIAKQNIKEFSRREAGELNWIINYPWIIESDEPNQDVERYYFSLQEKEFKYFIIKILNNNNDIKGLIFLSLKNGHLKVPYGYFDDEFKELAVDLIYLIMLKNHADTLTVFNPQVVPCIQSRSNPFWLVRKKSRPLSVAIKMISALDPKNGFFQDGDGDNVFT